MGIIRRRSQMLTMAWTCASILVWFAASPVSAAEDEEAARLVVSHASVGASDISLGLTFISGPDDAPRSSPDPDDLVAFEDDEERPSTARRVGGGDMEVAIVVDTSPGGHELDALKTSIGALVDGLPDGARMSLTQASDTPVTYVEPTLDKEVMSAAIDRLGRVAGTDIPQALNSAIDRFSVPGAFRTVILYASRYVARGDVTEFLGDRLTTERVSTYVVATRRSASGGLGKEVRLPLGGGRPIFAADDALTEAGATLANELNHQYEVVLTPERNNISAGVGVRTGWKGEELEAITIVQLKEPPKADSIAMERDERDPFEILRLFTVPVIAAAVLFIPSRLRAAFLRRRRRRSTPSPISTLVDAAGNPRASAPDTSWSMATAVDVDGAGQRAHAISAASGLGGAQVEGRPAVHELLRARTRRTRGIWILEGVEDRVTEELAQVANVPVRRVDLGVFRSVAASDQPDGVVAFAEPITAVSVDDLRPLDEESVTVVVIDGPTEDHQAFGGLLRGAVVAGASGVVFARSRGSVLHPVTTAAAGGAVEHLRFAGVGSLAPALTRLRALGFLVVAVDPGAAITLDDLHRTVGLATGPMALVIGADDVPDRRLAARSDVTVSVLPPAGHDPAGTEVAQWACRQFGQIRLLAGAGDNRTV